MNPCADMCMHMGTHLCLLMGFVLHNAPSPEPEPMAMALVPLWDGQFVTLTRYLSNSAT